MPADTHEMEVFVEGDLTQENVDKYVREFTNGGQYVIDMSKTQANSVEGHLVHVFIERNPNTDSVTAFVPGKSVQTQDLDKICRNHGGGVVNVVRSQASAKRGFKAKVCLELSSTRREPAPARPTVFHEIEEAQDLGGGIE